MKGGKLIGTGSSSCVLNPGIPCKRGKHLDKGRVTKLLFHKDAKNLSKYEEKQSNLISNINGYKEWAIIYDEFCSSPPYSVLEEYDREGIQECFKNDETSWQTIKYDVNKLHILNADYGGDTMKKVFKNTFTKMSNQSFFNFMKMMYPLFYGLNEMNQHDIVHNDIKSINIVEHNGVFKYIDFGLTSKVKTPYFHFKERSLKEFNTKRIYYNYPLDYIYFYVDINVLVDEIDYNLSNRKNYDLLVDLYKMMNYDINMELTILKENLLNDMIQQREMIKKIDVYSLGALVPLLFLNAGFNEPFRMSNIVYDFFLLFRRMIDPNPNIRISPEKALEEYLLLMDDYGKVYTLKKRSLRKKKKFQKKRGLVKGKRGARKKKDTKKKDTKKKDTKKKGK